MDFSNAIILKYSSYKSWFSNPASSSVIKFSWIAILIQATHSKTDDLARFKYKENPLDVG